MNKFNVPLEHKVSVSEAMEETNKLDLQSFETVLVFTQSQTFTDFIYQFSSDITAKSSFM